MKFAFLHILWLLSVIECKKGSPHHKHRASYHSHGHARGRHRLSFYEPLKFKYRGPELLNFRDAYQFYDSETLNFRDLDTENLETVVHHIRHHPELSAPEYHWPVKKEAVVEGDIILGGLMMVHEREDTITCGPVMPQGGIQALEAMLYTLDRLNQDLRLLPNISLGVHILDDCDKDTYGLEMAVDFIKGK